MRNTTTWFALLLEIAFLLSAPLAFAQSFSFPRDASLKQGTGECEDLYLAITNPHWRVRKGREFTVTAAHPLSVEEKLVYSWEVSNGKIVSGQGTPRLTLKAGGGKSRGYSNIDGHVSITLKVTRPAGCSVTANERVMVGQHQEYNGPTNVDDVTLDEEKLMWCEPGRKPLEGSVASKDMIVRVITKTSDPENDVPTYAYIVSGGSILGSGKIVDWDLTGVEPGTYTLTALAQDGYGVRGKVVKKQVVVAACSGGGHIECPTIDILGPAHVKAGTEALFTASVMGGGQQSVTYDWEVTNAEIVRGQRTRSISVRVRSIASETGRGSVSVTVKIGGLDPRGNCLAQVTEEFLEEEKRPMER